MMFYYEQKITQTVENRLRNMLRQIVREVIAEMEVESQTELPLNEEQRNALSLDACIALAGKPSAYSRLSNAAPRHGMRIATLADIVQFSKRDIMELQGCGIKTANDIEEALKQYGLQLRQD